MTDSVRAGAERLADDMELLCRIIADEAPNGGAQINRAFHAETGYWPADPAMAFRDMVLISAGTDPTEGRQVRSWTFDEEHKWESEPTRPPMNPDGTYNMAAAWQPGSQYRRETVEGGEVEPNELRHYAEGKNGKTIVVHGGTEHTKGVECRACNYLDMVQETRHLFELQYGRMAEATALWRAESPKERELVQPDLGSLLSWLMERAQGGPSLNVEHLARAIERVGMMGSTAAIRAGLTRNDLEEIAAEYGRLQAQATL